MNPFNNHPIRSSQIVGVHNGMLWNDDEIFDDMGINEYRQGEVDSEAIFAALAWAWDIDPATGGTRIPGVEWYGDILQCIEGSAAIAWIDEYQPNGVLNLARINQSPLVVAQTVVGSTIFASEKDAIIDAARLLRLDLGFLEELDEGSYVQIEEGRITTCRKFDNLRSGTVGRYRSRMTRYNGSTPNLNKPSAQHNYDAEPLTSMFVDASLLNLGTDVPKMDSKAFHSVYRQREDAISTWFSRLFGVDDAEAMVLHHEMHAFMRPGDWVRTLEDAVEVFGQVVKMPQQFPGGQYVLRLVSPACDRPLGFEAKFVLRTGGEFEPAGSAPEAIKSKLRALDGATEELQSA